MYLPPLKGDLSPPEERLAPWPMRGHTDSQRSTVCTAYVSAVNVRLVGRGARLFYSGEVMPGPRETPRTPPIRPPGRSSPEARRRWSAPRSGPAGLPAARSA